MSIQEKNTAILEEIKNILGGDENKSADCIDLWTVQQLRKNKYEECKKSKTRLNEQMRNVLKAKYGEDAFALIDRFDYAPDISKLGILVCYNNFYDENIVFAITKGDISICNAHATKSSLSVESRASEILKLLDLLLLEAYETYVFEMQRCQAICNIKPTNSNFLVSINLHGVEICFDNLKLKFQDCANQPKYDFDSYASYKVLEAISGQEEEIFQRIFVKIEDCPEWMHAALYEERQSQLAKLNKQKVLGFIKNCFRL